MTEAEFFSIPGAEGLPIMESDDPRGESLDRPSGLDYDTNREVQEFDEALALSGDPTYELRGGMRHRGGGSVLVFAYFWKLRD